MATSARVRDHRGITGLLRIHYGSEAGLCVGPLPEAIGSVRDSLWFCDSYLDTCRIEIAAWVSRAAAYPGKRSSFYPLRSTQATRSQPLVQEIGERLDPGNRFKIWMREDPYLRIHFFKRAGDPHHLALLFGQ